MAPDKAAAFSWPLDYLGSIGTLWHPSASHSTDPCQLEAPGHWWSPPAGPCRSPWSAAGVSHGMMTLCKNFRGSNEMPKTYWLLVQSYSITRLPSPSFPCWERPTIYQPFWKDETRPCAIKQKSGLPLPLLHVPNLSCPATRKTGCGPHLQQKTNLTNVLTYPPRFPQMFNASSSFSLSKSPFWVDSPLVKHTQIS